MKSWAFGAFAWLALTTTALAVSPAEQRLIDKAKEDLAEFREGAGKNNVDSEAAVQADLAAAKGATINQRLKTTFTRKVTGNDVVYEFKNAGYQVQKVKELEEKLAAVQKKGHFGHGAPQAKALPSPALNPLQLKRGSIGHLEYDTPAQRMGPIEVTPVDAESVTLTVTIERRFDSPDLDKYGRPVVRTEWKAVSKIPLLCGGVDPTNKDWKKPVFVVGGKQSVGGKSVTKLVQIDSGQGGP